MSSKLLSLLVFVLFASLVAARPQSLQSHEGGSGIPIDPKALTSTKRCFSLSSPVVRRNLTAATGKAHSTRSQCAKSGVIEVIDANTNTQLGFVSRDLRNQRYGLTGLSNAGIFSSSVFTCGRTKSISLQVVNDATHFLAGLIKKGEPLGMGGAGSVGDDTAAILGRSLPTNPGDPPQADKDPSITDRDAETAIWTYDRADDSLTARWVNYVGQHPASTMAYITFLTNGNKFYLTNIRISPPNAYPALFRYISINDECITIGE